MSASGLLTTNQAAALGRISQAPVPPAPALTPALLAAAPLSYQLLGLGGLLLKGSVILSLVALPFIKAPEREPVPPAQVERDMILNSGKPEGMELSIVSQESEPSRSGEPLRYLWHEEE